MVVGAILAAAAAVANDMIVGLDHIQLALPVGTQDSMHAFYCGLLGMTKQRKPVALVGRGGFWALAGHVQVHFGIDPNFHPATKAHPAFLVCDSAGVFDLLTAQGYTPKWDKTLPNVTGFFVADPVGNRVEIIEEHK